MSKILYLSNIDWNWIKQRPQFLAEELSENNDVLCVTPHWYNRKKLQTRHDMSDTAIKFKEFYGLPMAKRFLSIKKFNMACRNLMTKLLAKRFKPDVIYVTHPEVYGNWLNDTKALVIYDCMDNHCALAPSEEAAKHFEENEQLLIKASDRILVSSEALRKYVIDKYKADPSKIVTVRNGYSGKILECSADDDKHPNDTLHIGYIGTVSSWFDIDTLEENCLRNSDVIYHIIGPLHDVEAEGSQRIIYEGIVEHDKLYDKIKDYDALVMPFLLNDIVEAVDPVKLYEYINFAKPIITVYYDEIQRFEPFVYFYTNGKEYADAVEMIRQNGIKYNNKMRTEFLKNNSWKTRASEIEAVIAAAKHKPQ